MKRASLLRNAASVCAALLLGLHTPVLAKAGHMVGPWEIHDDPAACYMIAQNKDGIEIAVLIPKSDPTETQLRLSHSDWQSLTSHRKVGIYVQLDGQSSPVSRTVETFSVRGQSGIVIPFRKNYGTKIFRENGHMNVYYQDNILIHLSLINSDTREAYRAVQQCAGGRFDPFAAR